MIQNDHTTPKNTTYEPLTERESDILKLLVEGLSDREIADRLVVAYSTVKWYNRQIFNKLGVNGRREAKERAQQLGFFGIPEQKAEPRHNLPVQITPFIGRSQEIDDLIRLLRDENVRLLTILAPGGMGKTRLALETARLCLQLKHNRPGSISEPLFHYGVYFVPLAALRTIEHLFPTLADHIGFQFAPDDRPPLHQIIDFFKQKALLLVLDNFEHVLDGAPLLSDILRNAPYVKIIVTSRERLNLSGETIYTLSGMAYPEQTDADAHAYNAVQLFVQSARRIQPDFAPEGVTPDMVRVCQLTQGMPLAIELAAAWVGTLSVAEIADEVAQSVDFLRTTMRDVPERQHSVRAVFETTWQRLTEEQQAAFRRLSVMRGGCSRQAAQTVTGADPITLAELVNKALLWRNPVSGRYEIHELLRQYAERVLIDSGERDSLCEAHSSYYLNALTQRRTALEGGSQVEALHDIQSDFENVRAAWMWAAAQGDTNGLGDTLYSLWLYFEIRGLYAEGEAIFGQAVSALRSTLLEPEQRELLAHLLARQASFSARVGQIEKTQRLLNASAELITPATSIPVRAFLAYSVGSSHLESRFEAPVAARPHYKQALSLYQAAGLRWETAYTMVALADSLWYGIKDTDADYSEAAGLYTEAMEVQTAIGDLFGLSQTVLCLAVVLECQLPAPQPDAAREYLNRCIEIRRQLGHKPGIAAAFSNLGAVCLHLGEFAEAQQHLEASLALRREVGNVPPLILALNSLSYVAFEAGDFDRARSAAEEASILAAAIEDDTITVQVSCGLAAVEWAQGAYPQSTDRFRRTKTFIDEIRSEHPRSLALIAIDAFALAGADFDRERQHYQQQLRDEGADRDLCRDAFLHAALGKIAWHEGDVNSAASHLEASHAGYTDKARTRYSLVSECDKAQVDIFVLTTLANIEYVRGRLEAAHRHVEEALELARCLFGVPWALKGVAAAARLCAAEGQLPGAVELSTFIHDNAKAYATDRKAAGELISAVRELLQPEEFMAAVERGRLLTLDAAMEVLGSR